MDALTFDDVPFERENDTQDEAPQKVDFGDVSNPIGEAPSRPAPAKPAAPATSGALSFDDVPYEDGFTSDLMAGWESLKQSMAGQKLAAAESDIEQADKPFRPGRAAGYVAPPELRKRWAQDRAREAALEIGETAKTQKLYPAAPTVEAFNNAKSFGEAFSAFAADPLTITRSTIVRSAPSSLPSVVGGIIGSAAGPYGAALLAGSGSMISEFGSAIADGLVEKGADLEDPDSILKVWEQHGRDISQKAQIRSGIIGVVDAATAGVGSKIASLDGGTLKREAVKTIAGTAVQATGGGAGELGAQVGTGEEIKPGAIVGEVIGEIGSGSVETAGQIAVSKFKVGKTTDKGPDAAEAAAITGNNNTQGVPSTPTPAAGVDPAVTQAIAGQPVENPVERAKRVAKEKQAADAKAAQQTTPPAPGSAPMAPRPGATSEVTPPIDPSQQAVPPSAPAGQEPPAAARVESAAPTNADTPNANDELIANTPEEPPATPAVEDDTITQATEAVRKYRKPTAGFLAARLGVGIKRANKLLFELEDKGVLKFENGRFNIVDEPVTSEGNPDTNTVPESPDTIALQQQALVEGKRRAVFYPDGTKPAAPPQGTKRIKVPAAGIFDYNPATITPKEIRDAAKAGKLNELLDLGPVNKEQAAASALQGNQPVSVVERTPQGTEVKAAIGTTETAPEQVKAFEATKAAPANSVAMEQPEQVIADRVGNLPATEGDNVEADWSTLTPQEIKSAAKPGETKPKYVLYPGENGKRRMLTLSEAEDLDLSQLSEADKYQAMEEAGVDMSPDETAELPTGEAAKGKNWGKERERRAAAQKVATEIVAGNLPSEGEASFLTRGNMDARNAIHQRAKAMVAQAEERGIVIPGKIMDAKDESMRWGPDMMLLVEAKSLANKRVPKIPDYTRFVTREKALRAGQRDQVKQERKAEGDLAMRKDTVDVEKIGETPAAAKATARDPLFDDEKAATPAEAKTFSKDEKEAWARANGYLLRASVQGEEAVAELDQGDVLQEVTFAQALEQAGEVKGNGVNRSIVNRLLTRLNKKVGDTPIKIVAQETLDAMYPDRPAGRVDGYYDPQKDHIVLSANFLKGGQFDAQILAHEGVHAYLQQALDTDAVLRADIQEVLDFAKSQSAQKDAYGFSDVHEFLAEALSNHEFQNMLMKIKVSPQMAAKFDMPLSSGNSTLWGALVGSIRKHLGLGRKEVDALSYVLRLADRAEIRTNSSPDTNLMRGLRRLNMLSQGRQKRDFKKELTDAGVPENIASDLDDVLKNDLKDLDDNAMAFVMDDLKTQYGATAESKGPTAEEVDKKVQAQAGKLGKGAKKLQKDAEKIDFTPRKNPGRRNSWLLKAMTNMQIAQAADDFFGRYGTNPLRAVADLIERRRVRKQELLEELAPAVEKLVNAETAYRRGTQELRRGGQVYTTSRSHRAIWEDFTSLMNDATMAEVHPDLPIDDDAHKHLGKDALRGKWAKGQHAELAARYEALPDDLKELWAETRDHYTAIQDRMNYERLKNVLTLAGHDNKALIDRFFKGEATALDRKLVGPRVAELIEEGVELTRIAGPYFPLARRGDYRVQGTYRIEKPKNARALSDSEFEFKTRDEAVAFAERQELKPTIKGVWVDKNTGDTWATDIDGTEVKISKNDTDAEQRWRVAVQNRHVEFANSASEARQIAAQLRSHGLQVDDAQVRTNNVPQAPNADQLSEQMKAMAATLDSRQAFKDLSDAQRAELKEVLGEVSIRFLGSTRIQSRFIKRRGVEGASLDAVRNAYDYADAASGYLAKMDIQPSMDAAMKDMDARLSTLSSKGTGAGLGASELVKELRTRVLTNNFEEGNGAIDAGIRRLTQLAFLRFLASPAYSLFNMMQPHLVALPNMAAEYGEAKASAQFAKAYLDISGLKVLAHGVIDTARAVTGHQGRHFINELKDRLKSTDEKAMLDELLKIGFIDQDAGMMVARNMKRPDTLMGQYYDPVMGYMDNIARQGPKAIETMNRAVVALATYRLSKAEGKSHAMAVQDAKDMVDNTQGTYSQSNQAPIFRSSFGRVALQFKKYGQMMYHLFGMQVGRIIRNQNPGDRKRALKGLAYTLAIHQVAAGTMGLPWEPAKIIMAVLNGLGVIDYDWDDFKKDVEEFYTWLTGSPDAADMLTKGVTRGIPGVGFDMSSRVGLDSLMTFGAPRSYKEADVKSYFFDLFGGASASMGASWVKGLTAAIGGDFSKVTDILPFKFAVDVGKGVRGYTSGDMTGPEAVIRGFGVTPARQAKQQDERNAEYKEKRRTKDRYNELFYGYINAGDDKGKIAKLWGQIREWNAEQAKLPKDKRGQKIRRETVEKRRRQELRKKQQE